MNNQTPQNPFLEQEIDLREYARVLYERRWVIISATIILCTLALIRVFMMRPVYEASTKVLIQKEAPKVVNMQEVQAETYTGREYYQTQYKILKSRVIAERVDKALGGYVPWSEWTGRKVAPGDLTENERLEELLERVSVSPMPNTQLVAVRVEDVDPALAARIANLWAQNYIAYILDTKFNASRYASGWLQGKIKEAKDKLEKSEYRLQKYRKEHGLLADTTDSEVSMMDQLLEKKAELEIELSEKREYYKSKHPEIIGIKSEIGSVEEKIKEEREKELEEGEKSIEYNILKRDVSTNRDIYRSLLQRVGETEVMGELKVTNISIVDKAVVPERPSKPKKKLSFIIALLIGVLGGSAAAFLMESLDQSVKTPEDLKNRVGLPALASIAVPKDAEEIGADPEFVSSESPRSTVTEAYRSLRTSITFTAVEHRRKVLLLTSSGPQEGKTTTAINLAIVMAQTGEKTLLVDADLRKPRIEKAFNVEKKHGLTEVLSGEEDFEKTVHTSHIPGLDVLACGAIPPNPSELLGSRKMDSLLEELSKKYDRIIIDSPPVLAVTDPVVLTGKVDAVILVVKAGETNRNAASKAKEILESVGSENLIGGVLNMVEKGKTGGHYYYYEYYGKKHGAYIHDDKA
ncbi:MAG: polysaccharide biosynthesis tyrosine autokinase [Candidatus Omnitrophica bacterium]|nr:polysaccharide biosynthesis tyrosine autokinase [Candidatus Omnitrophota bacterium]